LTAVNRVDSLSVRDDTEIDWKLMADPDWNLWSAHTLQRRWLTLKKSVKGYEDMTHQGEYFISTTYFTVLNSMKKSWTF